MRVLLDEDEAMIGASLREPLRRQGMSCDRVRDGRAAHEVLRTERVDAVRPDPGLPQRDGLSVRASLRARGDTTPVIVLTARDERADEVTGLDSGADDSLVKPFELDGLLARRRALARRQSGRASTALQVANLRLHPATHGRSRGGRPVLSAREFALLQALLERPGTIPSRARREGRLHGWGEELESNAIGVAMHQPRRKPGDDLLHMVRGLGHHAGPAQDA